MALMTIEELIAKDVAFREYHDRLDQETEEADDEAIQDIFNLIELIEEKAGEIRNTTTKARLGRIVEYWKDRLDLCIIQNVYLKIERIPDYSPVDPAPDSGYAYRRDCFRRAGHDDGTIPGDEVEMRKLTAVVYRTYTDETFNTIDSTPLIATDIAEPPADRRVPGVLVYTQPGRRLRIHVLNEDQHPHSLHMHGIQYGINSDGAFPFGVETKQGSRSDQICPGTTHIYDYDVTKEMTGCWVFHDHFKHIGMSARLGLIGGLVVRDPDWPKADVEVPFFMHTMAGRRGNPVFDSGDIHPGANWSRTFDTVGVFEYRCFYHGNMSGSVKVQAGASSSVEVDILDSSFGPDEVIVAPGGTVTWTNIGVATHTVFESGSSSGQMSHTINGRSFAGNTPVIELKTGQSIRWYVFNLDFSGEWHNFHPHASHWTFGGQHLDNRSIGPAEAFVVDTVAPPVLLPPCNKEHMGDETRTVSLVANYPIHCHVEPHVMAGMVALMRVFQEIELPVTYISSLEFPLPEVADDFTCPVPKANLCVDDQDDGVWQVVPGTPAFAVHGALLKTGKVMLWSGHAEVNTNFGLTTAIYDPVANSFSEVPFSDNIDLFCAGNAFLPDGRLVVGGGDNMTVHRVNSTHIFDPDTESWSRLEGGNMRSFRWYPTMIAMPDGRTAIVSGHSAAEGIVDEIEVLDLNKPAPAPGVNNHYWDVVAGSTKTFAGLYPGLHVLPSGDIFFTRTGFNSHGGPGDAAAIFTFNGAASGTWSDLAPLNFPDRKEGSSVLLVDDSGAAPTAHIFVAGGKEISNPAITNCEIIDVTNPATTPGWIETAPMNHGRIGLSAVLLPNGKVMAVGGRQTSNRFDTNPIFVMSAEIYDPTTDTWALAPDMAYPRQYHSVALLLPDGRVLTSGGVDNSLSGPGPAPYNQQTTEIYSPEYLSAGPRPILAGAPATASYGETITIQLNDAAIIEMVCLMAPGAMTHHTDTNQRHIKLKLESRTASSVDVRIPANGNIAPPGIYMLFVISDTQTPSIAHFIQVS